MQQAVTILRGIAGADMEQFGLKQGDHFYMARDKGTDTFRVVKWDRVRWVCSCGQGKCDHKFQVNEFLTQEFIQSRMTTGDDLAAHLDDERRSRR
jgi:hypothetical protein